MPFIVSDPKNRHEIVPVLTYAFFFINFAVFAFLLVGNTDKLIDLYAFVPARFFGSESITSAVPVWATFFTASIMQAHPLHIAGNMFYWLVFADNIEYAFGKIRFVGF